ncbi:MAG: hypothetical protein KAU22_03135 [Desulfuromonadales bacterium]|nr:hypothetical protein [Desulfuromonadales bacterium]
MKTTLTLLIAGLIFLAVPMLASAEGRRHDSGQNHYNSWVKSDRHDQGQHYDRHDRRHNQRYERKQNRRTQKHLRRELRETRQELRQIKRQARHSQRHPYHVQLPPIPHPAAILLGLPHLAFHLDW